jgi:hypothetical protein
VAHSGWRARSSPGSRSASSRCAAVPILYPTAAASPCLPCSRCTGGALPAPRSFRRNALRIVYVWDSEYPWDVRTSKICTAPTDAGTRNRGRLSTQESLPEGTIHRMRPGGEHQDPAARRAARVGPREKRCDRRVDESLRDVRSAPKLKHPRARHSHAFLGDLRISRSVGASTKATVSPAFPKRFQPVETKESFLMRGAC